MSDSNVSNSSAVISANLLTISSVAAETVAPGMMQIVSSWKNSEKKTVAPANRTRAIVLPENIWATEMEFTRPVGDIGKMLHLHLHESLIELAKSYLSTICEESEMMRREVPISHFTLSSLLTWQSEMAAMSGRLNSEEIKNWLESSATIKAVISAHSAEVGKVLGEQFVKLAGPNHGLRPEKAAKILANLWQSEDCESNTGLKVQMRLTAISKKTAETASVLDAIL